MWDTALAAFMRRHNIPVPAALEAGTKLRFLIVDDEADYRRLLSRLIRDAYPEAEIAEAADGFEAGHKVHAFLPWALTKTDPLLLIRSEPVLVAGFSVGGGATTQAASRMAGFSARACRPSFGARRLTASFGNTIVRHF